MTSDNWQAELLHSWQESAHGLQPIISARFDSRISHINAADRPFKLGLFGGTFDPVHVGHLHIAQRAQEQFALDGILFIPTGKPVRKLRAGVSDAEDRHNMLLLAIAGNEHFDVSRIEIERKGTTYTIDTLRAIKQRYGDKAELFFIVGEDSALDIATWKDADQIAQLVTLLCAPRVAETKGVRTGLADVQPAATARIAATAASRTAATSGAQQIVFSQQRIDSALIDISSHELRAWVKKGRSLHYLVPEATCSYIREQGLYKS